MSQIHPRKAFCRPLLAVFYLFALVLTACTIVANPTPTETATIPAPTAAITPIPVPTLTPIPTRNPIQTADEDHSQHYLLDDFETAPRFSGEDVDGIGLGFVPWNKFHRQEIGNGAPRDGRTLTEVHGWAFGVVNPSPETVTYYLDQFRLAE